MVGREKVKNVVREETVEKALQGDIGSAVNIGMQAGVDLVILGNANSSLLKAGVDGGENSIQASISLQMVSVLKSAIVSAKSDFATAEDIDPMKAELQAFANVSKKLLVFLQPSIQRYWEKGTVENRNGLVRRFFPKRSNFYMIQDHAIQLVEDWINNRPMKCLGFKTPNQVFASLVALTG